MIRTLVSFLFLFCLSCSPPAVEELPATPDSGVSCSMTPDVGMDFNNTPPELPPTNITWDICNGIEGEHPCNILAPGFSLYALYGQPIVLDFSTMWCGPCNTAAAHAQEVQDNYADTGLVYITVLIENRQGNPPTDADVQEWINDYGLTTSPVIAGDRSWLQSGGGTWALTGWPTFYYIDREMVLRDIDRGYNAQEVIYSIEWLLTL